MGRIVIIVPNVLQDEFFLPPPNGQLGCFLYDEGLISPGDTLDFQIFGETKYEGIVTFIEPTETTSIRPDVTSRSRRKIHWVPTSIERKFVHSVHQCPQCGSAKKQQETETNVAGPKKIRR